MHRGGLQTTNTQEEETSCVTCLPPLQFRVSLNTFMQNKVLFITMHVVLLFWRRQQRPSGRLSNVSIHRVQPCFGFNVRAG